MSLQEALKIAGRENDVVMPLILYSDETILSGNMRCRAWPLVVSIANIPRERRGDKSAHALVALLPDVTGTADFKNKVFHKCLEVALKPLMEASHV